LEVYLALNPCQRQILAKKRQFLPFLYLWIIQLASLSCKSRDVKMAAPMRFGRFMSSYFFGKLTRRV
jgi:hypothetical protein